MIRIITWHIPYPGFPLPQFYAERDYTPEKVRIMAGNTPSAECQIDIRDDGVSIFAERGLRPEGNYVTRLIGTSKKNAVLSRKETLEEDADDFPSSDITIAAGSVLTCHEIDLAGASNITIQLELESADEEDEDSN